MNFIPPDPTNSDWPVRRISCSEALITEPAKRGFFLFRDTVTAMCCRFVVVVAAIGALGQLAGCAGPSENEVAQLVADEVHAVENTAPAHEQIDWLVAETSGDRPSHISVEDWELIQGAMKAMRGDK